jgi:hypothetical protein
MMARRSYPSDRFFQGKRTLLIMTRRRHTPAVGEYITMIMAGRRHPPDYGQKKTAS